MTIQTETMTFGARRMVERLMRLYRRQWTAAAQTPCADRRALRRRTRAADKTGARLVNEFGLNKSDVEGKLRGLRNEAWSAAKAARELEAVAPDNASALDASALDASANAAGAPMPDEWRALVDAAWIADFRRYIGS